jgi:hypothetical protein
VSVQGLDDTHEVVTRDPVGFADLARRNGAVPVLGEIEEYPQRIVGMEG